MSRNILNALGIAPTVETVTAYKTTKGALYEDYDRALVAETSTRIREYVELYLSRQKEKTKCDECDHIIDVSYDLTKFILFIISEMEENCDRS